MRIPVVLDLDTNRLVVHTDDVAVLEKNQLISPWSDGTARLRVNRFVLFVKEPNSGTEDE
jgi:hypothetical protein